MVLLRLFRRGPVSVTTTWWSDPGIWEPNVGTSQPHALKQWGGLSEQMGPHLFGSHHLRSPIGHRTAFGQDPRVRWAAYNEAKRGMQGKGDRQKAADNSRSLTPSPPPRHRNSIGVSHPEIKSSPIPEPAPK